MYLLFECGICSSLYQVQVEKLSNSLQKVVCPSCQCFHHFGASQKDSNAQSPTIEKVFSQNSSPTKTPATQEQHTIEQEVFWRCGVCETNYHFNLDKVTAQGVKVTCTTCFSFFILQKASVMVDLDHMLMHEVSPDKALPTNIPPENLLVHPPEIDEKEVSGKFNLSQLQEEMAKISTNETVPPIMNTPRPPKTIGFGTNESSKPKMPPPPQFLKESSKPKVPPKTNAYVQTPSTKTTTQPSIHLSDKPVDIKPNDMAWVNSFKSFNTQRRQFKMPQQIETTSVTFTEHNPRQKKTWIDRYLAKASIWTASICAFALLIVFGYRWYEKKYELEKPNSNEITHEPTKSIDPNKPVYGFPQLGE